MVKAAFLHFDSVVPGNAPVTKYLIRYPVHFGNLVVFSAIYRLLSKSERKNQ
jgi:hypothetical protein